MSISQAGSQVCPTHGARRSRGSILIVTMWVTIGLAAMVLVLAEAMRVEVVGSANEYSSLQAQAVQEGAVRYVLSQVDPSQPGWVAGQVPLDTNVASEAVHVGGGAFWIIRPNHDSTQTQTISYGIVDEASKINLNGASITTLSMLPDMTVDLANCIADWRDTTSHAGAKSDYYMMLNPPYQCKQAAFETVEELLLVKGFTTDVLFGQDANRNGVQDTGEVVGYGQFDRGLYPYVTVYSNQVQPGASTTPARHAVNVATAPAEVLAALPGIASSDVSAIIAAQQQQQNNITAIAAVPWVARTIAAQRRTPLVSPIITVATYQFSADIVSVSGDGRAFKRCRIVVDNRKSPPKVVYRQDLTSLGWPLSPDILTGLRAGKTMDQVAQPVSGVQGLGTK